VALLLVAGLFLASFPIGRFPWSARSAEAALQVFWSAKTFQPDLFPDLDLRQETRDFYQTFYGYALSDEQLDAIFNPTAP
jgi:iron complex transport system substrate-binding protein